MDYLSKAEKGKVDKYLPCLSYLKEIFKVGGGEVLPVVLDSRGAIMPNTEKVLKRMGIADDDIKTIVMNVLRSSIEMCNIFLDGQCKWMMTQIFFIFICYLLLFIYSFILTKLYIWNFNYLFIISTV